MTMKTDQPGKFSGILALERASAEVARSRAASEADLRAAQANRDLARQKLSRAEDLVARNFLAQQALDQARADYQVAEQKHLQARDQLRVWSREVGVADAQVGLRTLRAPFEGVVVERYLSAGERVEEKPVFKLARIDFGNRPAARGHSAPVDFLVIATDEIVPVRQRQIVRPPHIGTGFRQPVHRLQPSESQPDAVRHLGKAIAIVGALPGPPVQQPASDIGGVNFPRVFVLKLVEAAFAAAVAQAFPFALCHLGERFIPPEAHDSPRIMKG